jgi:hypothetical protein
MVLMRVAVSITCWLLLGLCVPGSYAAPSVSIDQGPIARVLRLSDVPQSKEGGLASGALSAAQLALNNDPTTTTRRAEIHILTSAGFRSSAIMRLYGRGLLQYKSTAIELTSSAGAAAALTAEAALCARSQAPAATTVTSTRDRVIPGAILVTFRPTVRGRAGGLELLARSGRYIVTLQATDKPDGVSHVTLERLLTTILARS